MNRANCAGRGRQGGAHVPSPACWARFTTTAIKQVVLSMAALLVCVQGSSLSARANTKPQQAPAVRWFLGNTTAANLLFDPQQRDYPYCGVADAEDHFKCDNARFSVLIQSGRPREYVDRVIAHYEAYPEVAAILVVWNHRNRTEEPPVFGSHFTKPLTVWRTPSNSLTHRFHPFPGALKTCAVLSTDDDLIPESREDVVFMFRLWQHHQNILVGPFARGMGRNETLLPPPSPGYTYRTDLPEGSYAFILTGFAFLHRVYLYHFTCHLKQALLDRVDAYTNCEDLLMNLLVSGLSSKAGVMTALSGSLVDYGLKMGSHASAGHYPNRTMCINDFMSALGANLYRQGFALYSRPREHDYYPHTVPPGDGSSASGAADRSSASGAGNGSGSGLGGGSRGLVNSSSGGVGNGGSGEAGKEKKRRGFWRLWRR